MIPIDSLPIGVQQPLSRVLEELRRTPFSFDDLVAYVERKRKKRVRIEEDRMPAGMTGYAVGLRDCDLICTALGLTPIQKLTTQLHEISHFIRGDIPLLSGGNDTPDYNRFVYLRNRFSLVESRQRFNDMYYLPREKDAEILARVFLQYIRAYELSTPVVAKNFYNPFEE